MMANAANARAKEYQTLGLLNKFILNLWLEKVLFTKLDLLKVIEIFLKITNNTHDFHKKHFK